MRRGLTLRLHSKVSFAVAVLVAYMEFKGICLLIQTASKPLGQITAALINALLVRGWRDVMLLNDTQYPPMMLVPTAVYGIVFVAIGLLIGAVLLRSDRSQPS